MIVQTVNFLKLKTEEKDKHIFYQLSVVLSPYGITANVYKIGEIPDDVVKAADFYVNDLGGANPDPQKIVWSNHYSGFDDTWRINTKIALEKSGDEVLQAIADMLNDSAAKIDNHEMLYYIRSILSDTIKTAMKFEAMLFNTNEPVIPDMVASEMSVMEILKEWIEAQ